MEDRRLKDPREARAYREGNEDTDDPPAQASEPSFDRVEARCGLYTSNNTASAPITAASGLGCSY